MKGRGNPNFCLKSEAALRIELEKTMTQKEQWALKYSEAEYASTDEQKHLSTIAYLAWLDGFETAKEKLAEKMNEDCYDQECGFSSWDIQIFGDDEI